MHGAGPRPAKASIDATRPSHPAVTPDCCHDGYICHTHPPCYPLHLVRRIRLLLHLIAVTTVTSVTPIPPVTRCTSSVASSCYTCHDGYICHTHSPCYPLHLVCRIRLECERVVLERTERELVWGALADGVRQLQERLR